MRRQIEEQLNQRQISDWLALARKHFEGHEFGEARRALKELFRLRPDDVEAARLKGEVDGAEKEAEIARAEKEHLYSLAVCDQENGEIGSAVRRLKSLVELSRNIPGASHPERDKLFETFYDDLRSERDRIETYYSEGTRELAEKHFEKALEICDGILARYPQDLKFQALRLRVDQSQRQQLSAYLAEVGQAVDNELDLDRRVALLEEAAKRYPRESQFSSQHSLACALRDLVASIVAKARAYEEQGQFGEAIAQLATISNLHPSHPGVDFEIHQLEQRREQQKARGQEVAPDWNNRPRSGPLDLWRR